MISAEYRLLGKSTVAGALFAENLNLWLENGYFDERVWQKPLRHLWSLAVEEQFYIAFPLTLLVLIRATRRVTACLAGIALVSFILNVHAVDDQTVAVFLSPLTRAWEFLVGCLIAALPRGWMERRRHLPDLAAAVGLGLVVYAGCAFYSAYPYPGWRAGVPVAGAALIIAAGPRAIPNHCLLAHPVMVYLGLISYPLYLWHWPALSFMHLVTELEPAPVAKAWLILGSFFAAVATYHGVEQRLRQRRTPLVTAGLIAAAAVCSVAGWLVFRGVVPTTHDDHRYDAEIARAIADWGVVGAKPLASFPVGSQRCETAGGDGPVTLYWGDSHMMQYLPRIYDLVKDRTGPARGIEMFAAKGTPPPAADLLVLARDHRVDAVVLAAFWDQYFTSDPGHHAEDGTSPELTGPQKEAVRADFERLVAELTRAGKAVSIVLDTPYDLNLDPRHVFGDGRLRAEGVREATVLAREGESRTFLIAVAARHQAQVIDPLKFLLHGSVCPAITDDGHAIFIDYNHLSATFVREHVRYLDATVDGPAASPP
jgi:peptidoglycan/LPS O-acetylase OafA/YrhL